jgi:hypothetical protein
MREEEKKVGNRRRTGRKEMEKNKLNYSILVVDIP